LPLWVLEHHIPALYMRNCDFIRNAEKLSLTLYHLKYFFSLYNYGVTESLCFYCIVKNMLISMEVGTLHRLKAVAKMRGSYICPNYQICVGANAQS